jgi:hypothetical protein
MSILTLKGNARERWELWPGREEGRQAGRQADGGLCFRHVDNQIPVMTDDDDNSAPSV